MSELEELVELDEATARAVQVVLRRAGIQSEMYPSSPEDWLILVHPTKREQALQVMANRMEEVITVRDHKPAPKRLSAGTKAYLNDADSTKPLLTTRLKNLTYIVLILFIPSALTLGSNGTMTEPMIATIWGVTLMVGGFWFLWGRQKSK